MISPRAQKSSHTLAELEGSVKRTNPYRRFESEHQQGRSGAKVPCLLQRSPATLRGKSAQTVHFPHQIQVLLFSAVAGGAEIGAEALRTPSPGAFGR